MYRIVETIVVRDVARHFAENKEVHSTEFFCPYDPTLSTFKVVFEFDAVKGTVGTFLMAVNNDVSIRSIKYVLFDEIVELEKK